MSILSRYLGYTADIAFSAQPWSFALLLLLSSSLISFVGGSRLFLLFQVGPAYISARPRLCRCSSTATLISSFILYQGLKASAITLITMVLGFSVICLGITLLQMSKVDPKQLTGLDRKSTMLFEAAHHPTEEAEKGEVSAMEDPGMDALRGGFGAVGSIIRARSMSRRMSSASSLNGKTGYPYRPDAKQSTQGLAQLQRFQRQCRRGNFVWIAH